MFRDSFRDGSGKFQGRFREGSGKVQGRSLKIPEGPEGSGEGEGSL